MPIRTIAQADRLAASQPGQHEIQKLTDIRNKLQMNQPLTQRQPVELRQYMNNAFLEGNIRPNVSDPEYEAIQELCNQIRIETARIAVAALRVPERPPSPRRHAGVSMYLSRSFANEGSRRRHGRTNHHGASARLGGRTKHRRNSRSRRAYLVRTSKKNKILDTYN